jgi:uracil-DNA glycosylase family 4
MNPFARSPKPSTCSGCALEKAGAGFVPPSGPPTSKILFVGESPGQREADTGVPFSGPAGGKFGHLLYRLGRERAAQRVSNLIWCKPPQDKLENTSYQYAAVSQCRTHLQPVLDEGHLVVVALGAVPARELLNAPSASIKDLHGTVTWLPRSRAGKSCTCDMAPWEEKPGPCPVHDLPASADGFYVVPTFHPSHLIRGAHNLTGTVYYDLNRAFEIADSGTWDPDEPKLHLDPSPEFFSWWVDQYLQLLRAEPLHTWLAVDIETPDKQRELDEGELKSVDRSMEILRVNFSYDAGEGLTVPFVEPYVTIMRRALEAPGAKWYWNKPYDLKRLRKHFKMSAVDQLDGMDAWKALHSDTPRGLGFVAPFYSRFGPWKHLSGSSPVVYAAIDSVQTIRCAFGLAADLHAEGRWDVFYKHMHEFGVYATLPACDVGLMVDRRQLEGYEDPATGQHVPGMQENLAKAAQDLFDQMQTLVPDELKPLHPKDGWTERPEGETYVWPKEGEPNSRPRFIVEQQEKRHVKVCLTCGCKQRVTAKHRCKDPETGKPSTPTSRGTT